ncbi:hypothetical protein FC26_GL000470 [Paucilactobacillus vaccinostercus DSM 20634]|uniref:Uncharacterized protein n=1 Tax=Paucilactobacillus vaccinostercus DSM 20634 TaxID=1423813 RepID=A0A0R1ZZW1_9LACO|nr:hypothetical protein [Paucilactobacillus vaccinostercus]KRM60385.1 hypothetical protein FC26_GL000470 [Paucilactobacillus vaccinostercus DSM 20634]
MTDREQMLHIRHEQQKLHYSIKKVRGRLLAQEANLILQHSAVDQKHSIGTDEQCPVCCQYNTVKRKSERLAVLDGSKRQTGLRPLRRGFYYLGSIDNRYMSIIVSPSKTDAESCFTDLKVQIQHQHAELKRLTSAETQVLMQQQIGPRRWEQARRQYHDVDHTEVIVTFEKNINNED